MKFQLEHSEPLSNSPDELCRVLLARFGLLPRKKDSTAAMHRVLLELVDKKKLAARDKKPELAVMTVDHMGAHAGISRQTMYEYLSRWLDLNILKKTSFISDGKVVIGYELNGPTLEHAFRKAESAIQSHLNESFKIIGELQREIKRDKLRADRPTTNASEGPQDLPRSS